MQRLRAVIAVSVMGLLASVVMAATPATAQATLSERLPQWPANTAVSFSGVGGKHVTPGLVLNVGNGLRWTDRAKTLWPLEPVLKYASTCKSHGWPVVPILNAPDRPLWGGDDGRVRSVSELSADYAALYAGMANRFVRPALIAGDAEFVPSPKQPWADVVAAVFTPAIKQWPGQPWGNFGDAPIPAAVTPKILRNFGARDCPEDAAAPGAWTVNNPVWYLNTGNGQANNNPQGRIGTGCNRIKAAYEAEPDKPVVPWVGSLYVSDPHATREECRAWYVHVINLTGGRALLFDQVAAPGDPQGRGFDEGRAARDDWDASVDQWQAAVGPHRWVAPLNVADLSGFDDSYVITWCLLDDGERACVVKARDDWTKPLQVAIDHDGTRCVVPPPAAGVKTVVTVFPAAK